MYNKVILIVAACGGPNVIKPAQTNPARVTAAVNRRQRSKRERD